LPSGAALPAAPARLESLVQKLACAADPLNHCSPLQEASAQTPSPHCSACPRPHCPLFSALRLRHRLHPHSLLLLLHHHHHQLLLLLPGPGCSHLHQNHLHLGPCVLHERLGRQSLVACRVGCKPCQPFLESSPCKSWSHLLRRLPKTQSHQTVEWARRQRQGDRTYRRGTARGRRGQGAKREGWWKNSNGAV